MRYTKFTKETKLLNKTLFQKKVSTGRELTDIYLKHPGNESSEDEEGMEEEYVPANSNETEESDFESFVSHRRDNQKAKAKAAEENNSKSIGGLSTVME